MCVYIYICIFIYLYLQPTVAHNNSCASKSAFEGMFVFRFYFGVSILFFWTLRILWWWQYQINAFFSQLLPWICQNSIPHTVSNCIPGFVVDPGSSRKSWVSDILNLARRGLNFSKLKELFVMGITRLLCKSIISYNELPSSKQISLYIYIYTYTC